MNLNDGIHDVMDRKGKYRGRALEEFDNGIVALRFAKVAAVPDAIFDEQRGDALGIVVVVAKGTVTRLELFDILDVFQSLCSCSQFFDIRHVRFHRTLWCCRRALSESKS